MRVPFLRRWLLIVKQLLLGWVRPWSGEHYPHTVFEFFLWFCGETTLLKLLLEIKSALALLWNRSIFLDLVLCGFLCKIVQIRCLFVVIWITGNHAWEKFKYRFIAEFDLQFLNEDFEWSNEVGRLFALLGTFVAFKIKFGSAITYVPKSIKLIVDLIDLICLGWKCLVEALLEGRWLQFGRIRRLLGQI